MPSPVELYQLLIGYAAVPEPVEEVLIGPVWTLCRTARGVGLAMSPTTPTRTLTWSGTLSGRPVAELAAWVRDWEPYAAAVGMATINAALAELAAPPTAVPLETATVLPANLAVFEHFLPELAGRRVAVVGHYPGIEALSAHCRLTVLERQPEPGDLPDAACEYVLPEADWVFLTASAITNKTFPRLAELAKGARTVLMGPTTPWLPELAAWGIDILAGIEVLDPVALRQTVAEGGGVRIFQGPVRYRIAALDAALRLTWLKDRIAALFAEKEKLDRAMETWYLTRRERFPDWARLESVRDRLSLLDTAYKALWDAQHGA